MMLKSKHYFDTALSIALHPSHISVFTWQC